MRNITLFTSPHHKFILLNESEPGEEEGVRSNQYLILHGDHGILLDPGGFGVMPNVLNELVRYIEPSAIRAIVLSHQDPDIVGGLSTWLHLMDAPIYVSRIWLRFLPHYGLQKVGRFIGVPDEGMVCQWDTDFTAHLVPAHFLHSEGQLNVYDPISRVLFTGDIGAAMLPDNIEYNFVDDFQAHLPYIEKFHRRFMGSNRAAKLWVETISDFTIDFLAPQHGPVYRGQAVVDFLHWLNNLQCGIDLLEKGGRFHGDVL